MSTDAERKTPEAEPVPEAGSVAESVKIVVTLTLVAALSAGLLGLVYSQTKAPIDQARAAEFEGALKVVLPAFETQEWRCLEPAGAERIEECAKSFHVARAGDRVVAYAAKTFTTDGFGPRIDLLVGASAEGAVTGVYVLGHQETPGLGALATDGQTEWVAWREECAKVDGGCRGARPFLRQLANRRLDTFKFTVRKDGGDVDAITASTITSRAVAEAVGAALDRIATERQAGGAVAGGKEVAP